MWTRNLLILACCLTPLSVLAASGIVPQSAEVIPAPSAAAPQMSDPMADDMACEVQYPVPATPWFYWWHAYRGRGQHYAYLPPVPGWYYFRPYSVSQLRMQQQAVQTWGGDPRNPYANTEFQQVYGNKASRPVSP